MENFKDLELKELKALNGGVWIGVNGKGCIPSGDGPIVFKVQVPSQEI